MSHWINFRLNFLNFCLDKLFSNWFDLMNVICKQRKKREASCLPKNRPVGNFLLLTEINSQHFERSEKVHYIEEVLKHFDRKFAFHLHSSCISRLILRLIILKSYWDIFESGTVWKKITCKSGFQNCRYLSTFKYFYISFKWVTYMSKLQLKTRSQKCLKYSN